MTSVFESSVSPKSAEKLEAAKRHYENGDMADYYLTLEAAALSFNPEAEYLLGRCYLYQIGVPSDIDLAIDWLLKAAEHGCIKAYTLLADCYIDRRKSEDDYISALKWLVPAEKAGDNHARYLLWVLYENGLGVPRDEAAALKWLVSSADGGHSLAQYHLGRAYRYGRGVEADRDKSFELYKKAADNGYSHAAYMLAWEWHTISSEEKTEEKKLAADRNALYWSDRAIEMGYSNAELMKALTYIYGSLALRDEEKAAPTIIRLAEEGCPLAQSELANLYRTGSGVEQDSQKRIFWLKNAALGGVDTSAQSLGIVFRKGQEGVEADPAKAREWFELAVDLGNVNALLQLGAMYFSGELHRDEKKAFGYFQAAAEKAVLPVHKAKAYEWLAFCSSQGKGTDKDWGKALFYGEKAAEYGGATERYEAAMNYGYRSPSPNFEKAAFWFEKAAELGHTDAQVKIGYFYHTGKGVKQNYQKAFEWFLAAAECGNANAMNNIGDAYYNGCGVRQDFEKAFEWLQKAALMEQADALFLGGKMLFSGKGTVRNEVLGLEWIKKAAEAKNKEATKWLRKKH